jgi:hypothetical protein
LIMRSRTEGKLPRWITGRSGDRQTVGDKAGAAAVAKSPWPSSMPIGCRRVGRETSQFGKDVYDQRCPGFWRCRLAGTSRGGRRGRAGSTGRLETVSASKRVRPHPAGSSSAVSAATRDAVRSVLVAPLQHLGDCQFAGPYVLGFRLLNEPQGTPGPCGV